MQIRRNIVGYIITAIIGIVLGCATMYGIIYFYPTSVINTINKVEKQVTVNDKGISDGIEMIYDAVVVVENYKNSTLTGIGSGFIYDENGYIITNHHVVSGATEIRILFNDGKSISAEVLGSDDLSDIAVIKIDNKYVKEVAKIGDSTKTKIGDTVFAVGSPMNSQYAGTVTRGILSGKNRMVEVSINSSNTDWIMNVMQTDAAINPGNSGGPLCNVSGEVIGVNNMKIVESSVEGVGFSIPIEDAILYAEKIISGEEIKRSFLGVRMIDLTVPSYYLRNEEISIDESITSGIVVVESITNGPAHKGGIEKGDVIVKIGSQKVNTVAELRYYLYKYNPKEEIDIEIIRGTSHKTFKVKLEESE